MPQNFSHENIYGKFSKIVFFVMIVYHKTRLQRNPFSITNITKHMFANGELHFLTR